MSELNESVYITVGDATVVTVPLVDNLTSSNAAPKASTVGAALDEKVDASDIMEYVTITFDGVESDNQGVLIVDSDDIPYDGSNNAPSIKDKLDGLDAKTGNEILYASGGSTIKAKVDALETSMGTIVNNLYADQIAMSSSDSTKVNAAIAAVAAMTASDIDYVSGTTIKQKVDGLETSLGTISSAQVGMVKVTSQTFTDAEQLQARSNIGAAGSAETVNVNIAQSLNTTQQTQARTNIDAVGTSETVLVNESQSLNATQQGQARSNIGAVSQTDFSNRNVGLWQVVDLQLADEETLAAGTVATYTATPSAISGYSLVGIVGTSMDGSNSSYIFTRNAYIDSYGAVKITCRNTGSSAATVILYAKLLYIKD